MTASPSRPEKVEETTVADIDVGRREFVRGVAALGAGVLVAGCAASGQRSGTTAGGEPGSGFYTLKDGTRLHYIEAGRGKPVVLIPGWSQTAAMFGDQIKGLSGKYRVIALDMRGHGESSKPAGGYRMAQLAQDTHEFIHGMKLDDVALGGHSMGASVMWSYWDHFGADYISRMIVIDQAPTVVAWPGWSDEEKALAGALFTPETLYQTAAALAGPDGVKTTEGFVRSAFFTKAYPTDKLDWVVQENLKFPRGPAAKLLVDHCCQDWRDVIPTIDVPTVVFGGTKSFFNPRSQQWIASQIRGAKTHIYEEAEGGSHFMFMENPDKFNRQVLEFLG
jgi:pimeloyl-ACP methyl ester carboxylesterase